MGFKGYTNNQGNDMTTLTEIKTVSPEFIINKARLLSCCNFQGSKVYHVKNKNYSGKVRIYWSKYNQKIEIDWNFKN